MNSNDEKTGKKRYLPKEIWLGSNERRSFNYVKLSEITIAKCAKRNYSGNITLAQDLCFPGHYN